MRSAYSDDPMAGTRDKQQRVHELVELAANGISEPLAERREMVIAKLDMEVAD